MFDSSKDGSTEVLVNLMASLTRSNQLESAKSLIQEHKNEFSTSYDLVFNSACALIEGRDLFAAEEQLKLAEKQCRKALEGSEGGVEELNSELAPILTQLAYVKQLRGDEVAAANLYDKVLSMGISDLSVIAVCNNNLVSLRSGENIASSVARLTNLAKTQTQDKLSATQKRIVLYNRCILLLQAGKFDDLQKLVKTLDSGSELTTLIQSATLLKKGQAGKAVEVLRDFVRQTLRDAPPTSTAALRVQLSLAQIQLNQNNVKEAIGIMKNITCIQTEPVYLATMVSLYQKIGELGSALVLLDETAAKLMANKKTMDVAHVTMILRKSAELKLTNSMFSQATETLSKILTLNPNDVRIQATLALALASVDPGRAEMLLKDLPKVAPSPNDEALETAPTPVLRRAVPVAVSAAAHAAATADKPNANKESAAKEAIKKQKKKRKNRPATKAQPGQTADPERWIPRHLRKGFKRRGAAAKATGQGHQGAATNEALNKANTIAPKAAPSAPKTAAKASAAKKRPGGRRR